MKGTLEHLQNVKSLTFGPSFSICTFKKKITEIIYQKQQKRKKKETKRDKKITIVARAKRLNISATEKFNFDLKLYLQIIANEKVFVCNLHDLKRPLFDGKALKRQYKRSTNACENQRGIYIVNFRRST